MENITASIKKPKTGGIGSNGSILVIFNDMSTRIVAGKRV